MSSAKRPRSGDRGDRRGGDGESDALRKPFEVAPKDFVPTAEPAATHRKKFLVQAKDDVAQLGALTKGCVDVDVAMALAAPSNSESVNRFATTPMLVRVFIANDEIMRPDYFMYRDNAHGAMFGLRGPVPKSTSPVRTRAQHQLVWADTTLRELVDVALRLNSPYWCYANNVAGPHAERLPYPYTVGRPIDDRAVKESTAGCTAVEVWVMSCNYDEQPSVARTCIATLSLTSSGVSNADAWTFREMCPELTGGAAGGKFRSGDVIVLAPIKA